MHTHRADLPDFIEKTITPFHACVLGLQRLRMPVIACAHGALAGGGFSLAMACDFVVAARSARFVVAYPKLGAPADGGLSFFMFHKLGSSRGLEALTTGSPFTAEQALQIGLVNRVVPPTEVNGHAQAQAKKLAAKPLSSLIETKRLMKGGQSKALIERMGEEGQSFRRMLTEPAAREAFGAFMEKRKPDFTKI